METHAEQLQITSITSITSMWNCAPHPLPLPATTKKRNNFPAEQQASEMNELFMEEGARVANRHENTPNLTNHRNAI